MTPNMNLQVQDVRKKYQPTICKKNKRKRGEKRQQKIMFPSYTYFTEFDEDNPD